MRFDRCLPAGTRAARVFLLASAAFLAGCGTSTTVQPPPLPPLGHVTLTPALDTLAVGGQLQFVAAAYDTNGTVVSGAGFAWTSTDPLVCTVSNSGLATAVGEGSTIVTAEAGGRSAAATVYVHGTQTGWFTQASGTTNALAAVCFLPDGHTGYAVGDLGTMVVTTNAGATWAPRTSGTSSHLKSVWFSSSSSGWAVGSGGTVMHSVNGGVTWTRLLGLGTADNMACVRFADAAHGWIVGDAGLLMRTANGGGSWTVQHQGGKDLFGVAFSDTSNGWAVGNGIILGTVNGGVTWNAVAPTLTSQPLRSVARLSVNGAWAVGALGSTASTQSSVSGPQWSLANQGAGYDLNGVHMVNALVGYAVGNNAGGAILRTIDGGATWQPQTSNSAQALNGVYFADPLRGWAVGAAGRIVHTSTGGTP